MEVRITTQYKVLVVWKRRVGNSRNSDKGDGESSDVFVDRQTTDDLESGPFL